jgi:SAM-dependent methyltransferase
VKELFDVFQKLESSGRLAKLFDAGLVRTWAPPEEGPNILAHEYVPFVSYPQEWTLEMLRSAALCTLDIAIELADAGMRLHDTHPWNVTFVHDRPVFLDFSSIKQGAAYDVWPSTFFTTFYVPLWLRKKRLFTLSRMIATEDHPLGAKNGARSTGRYLFSRHKLGALAMRYHWLARRISRVRNPKPALLGLRADLAKMRLPRKRSEWGQYYEPGGDYNDLASYSGKAQAVRTLLSKLPPGRLLDVACNHGWFSGLAATMGHCVLGVDLDENAVDIALRERAGKYGFAVACMNLLWPTPQQGEFLQLESTFDRWRADTALMIALTHHLVLKQRITFDGLASFPAEFGARHVIVEWIPHDDPYLRRWAQRGVDIPSWYREENFVQAFARRWPRFEKVPSDVRNSDGIGVRQMYLFRPAA